MKRTHVADLACPATGGFWPSDVLPVCTASLARHAPPAPPPPAAADAFAVSLAAVSFVAVVFAAVVFAAGVFAALFFPPKLPPKFPGLPPPPLPPLLKLLPTLFCDSRSTREDSLCRCLRLHAGTLLEISPSIPPISPASVPRTRSDRTSVEALNNIVFL